MFCYWDTSAIIAQVLKEPDSDTAIRAATHSEMDFSWAWLKVEGAAALSRRKATPSQWQYFETLISDFQFLEISENDYSELVNRNKKWKLRSADAAHLFCYEKFLLVYPEITLVTLDLELRAAAKKEKYEVF